LGGVDRQREITAALAGAEIAQAFSSLRFGLRDFDFGCGVGF